MYRTSDAVQWREPASSLITTAVDADALIAVGSLSLVVAALVVGCHLYRTFAQRGAGPVFLADDRLILAYFYAVIIAFVAVAVL